MLEFKKQNIVELPFEILEQAHWRPREVELCCKYKKPNDGEYEYKRLQRLWRTREVFFNFSLNALLMSLRPSEMAGFAEALSDLRFDSAYLFSGYSANLKKIIGVPDFIIGDETSAILAEIKITAKYDLQQFVKYQTFAMLCKALNYLPDNFSHLIITANLEPNILIKDYRKNWQPELKNNNLLLSINEQEKVLLEMRENISKIKLKADKSLPGNLDLRKLERESKILIPTNVISWKDFTSKFNSSTKRTDLTVASEDLYKIATGKIEI